jgi:hypothetical protein
MATGLGSSGGLGSSTVFITLAIVVIVVARFLIRELRERRIALSRIFLIPALLTVIVLYLVYLLLQVNAGLTPLLAVAALPAAIVGAVIAVSRFTTVRPGDQPGTVFIRGSYVTVAIWIAALALRLVARAFVLSAGIGMNLVLNAALLMMLVVAFTTVRLRILAEARSFRGR